MTLYSANSLLSITGLAEELVLCHLGESEGGVKAILNLRLTCKATKLWIDSLSSKISERVFYRAQIRMSYSTQSIKRFLRTTPPFQVNSLIINGMEHKESESLKVIENYRNQLTSFWVNRLECLEVKNDGRILSCRQIIQLLESERLKSIKFTSFPLTEDLNSFPPNTGDVMVLQAICATKNLICFELCLELSYLPHLETLIKAKSDNVKFKLIVTVANDQSLYRRLNINVEPLINTCNIIAASNFDVVLRISSFCNLNKMLPGLESEVRHQICNCVESIAAVNQSSGEFRPQDFPNLKYVGQVKVEELDVQRVCWPSSLQKLGFSHSDSFISTSHLPSTLTSLIIKIKLTSVNELLTYFASLAEECSLLTNLEIDCDCRWLEIQEDSATSIKPVFFPKLKSFEFGGIFIPKECVFVPKLMDVLRLHEQSLRHLCLTLAAQDRNYGNMLGKETISKFCDGKLTKTLQSFDVCDYSVTKDAQELVNKLRCIVELNRRRIRETLGRRHIFNPTSFNPFCYNRRDHPHCRNYTRKKHKEKKCLNAVCNVC